MPCFTALTSLCYKEFHKSCNKYVVYTKTKQKTVPQKEAGQAINPSIKEVS